MRSFIVALALGVSVPAVQAAVILSFVHTPAEQVGSMPGSALASAAVHLGTNPSHGLFMIGDFGLFRASPGIAQGLSGAMYLTSGPASFDAAAADDGNAAVGMLEWLGYHVMLPQALAVDRPSSSATGSNQTFTSLGVTLGDLVYRLEDTNDTITLRFSNPPSTALSLPGAPALAAFATIRSRQPAQT